MEKMDYLGGRERAKSTPRCTQASSRRIVCHSVQPRPQSSRTWAARSGQIPGCGVEPGPVGRPAGPTRTMRSEPFTPQAILPISMKPTPPNIFFSTTFGYFFQQLADTPGQSFVIRHIILLIGYSGAAFKKTIFRLPTWKRPTRRNFGWAAFCCLSDTRATTACGASTGSSASSIKSSARDGS